MKWTTEVPKESGWYWVKLSLLLFRYKGEDVRRESTEPIEYNSETGHIYVFGYEDFYDKGSVIQWSDKLEIPE